MVWLLAMLVFADNLILMGESVGDLQKNTKCLYKIWLGRWSRMNIEKSKVMVGGEDEDEIVSDVKI